MLMAFLFAITAIKAFTDPFSRSIDVLCLYTA